MKLDRERVTRYLMEIMKNSGELQSLVAENHLEPDSLPLKAAKYILIELAEGISLTLQHILAKQKGMAVSGYIDTIVKGHQAGILSEALFDKLKPFLDFRNSLVHRYWTIDDTLLIQNLVEGHKDFQQFVDEIEGYLKETEKTE